MGLQLPGELVSLLHSLGYKWPEADETKLFEMGRVWLKLPSRVSGALADAQKTVERMWSDNQDSAIEVFRGTWSESESPKANMDNGAVAANLIGAGLIVCAGIVLALKINVIAQLVTLAIEIAQAIAAAPATFGASLAEIPIFKEITSIIIDQLLNTAIGAVLGG